ncbi:unnamed protein product, partial [Dicrocoelium dendriticum]
MNFSLSDLSLSLRLHQDDSTESPSGTNQTIRPLGTYWANQASKPYDVASNQGRGKARLVTRSIYVK